MLRKVIISTKKPGLYEINSEITGFINEIDIQDGACVVFTTNSESAIIVTSYHDPLGHEDILNDLNRIFPARTDYRNDKGYNIAASHTKSALASPGLDLPILNGKPILGSCEKVYLADFVGGKKREILIRCIA